MDAEGNAEENKGEQKTQPPRRAFNVDGFVSGCGKVFSMGETPGDPVVKALKRFSSWLKYILLIEVVGGFVAFMPYYSVKLIREGRADDLAEFMLKAAEVMQEETENPNADAEAGTSDACPQCGSENTTVWEFNEKEFKLRCNDCENIFDKK